MKQWYLKYLDHFVGTLYYDEDNDLFSLDIENPRYFIGRMEKLFLNDEMCRRWMESRLTPQYQGGYTQKMEKLGLDVNDANHRIKLFFLTRACNIRDAMWIADNKDDSVTNAPFYGL